MPYKVAVNIRLRETENSAQLFPLYGVEMQVLPRIDEKVDFTTSSGKSLRFLVTDLVHYIDTGEICIFVEIWFRGDDRLVTLLEELRFDPRYTRK